MSTFVKLGVVLLVITVLGGIGGLVYQAGLAAGAPSSGASDAVRYGPWMYGWHPWGFGPFGFFAVLLTLFLFFGLLRGIFGGGMHHGHHGGSGRGPWED